MIKERKSLAMYEVKELLEEARETEKGKELKGFIKKFSKLTNEKSKKLKEELEKLELIKLKQSDIIKIVDIAPENATELNKIFTETSLDADETAKILETIKSTK
jgi:DNA-directed RNA polymerase subunit F